MQFSGQRLEVTARELQGAGGGRRGAECGRIGAAGCGKGGLGVWTGDVIACGEEDGYKWWRRGRVG